MLSSPQYHSDVTFTTTMIILPTVRRDSVVTEVGSVSQVPEFGLVTRAHTSWTSHKYIILFFIYISIGFPYDAQEAS